LPGFLRRYRIARYPGVPSMRCFRARLPSHEAPIVRPPALLPVMAAMQSEPAPADASAQDPLFFAFVVWRSTLMAAMDPL